MALYGHEISDKINVWEAGLERYCKMEKGDFVGRAALEQARTAGLRRTLVGIEMVDRGIARDRYCCCNEAGDAIGEVTSGSPSPTLGKKHCAGLCAAGVFCGGHGSVRGDSRAEVQGAGGPDAVLQAAEESSGSARIPDRTQKNPRSDVMAYPKNYRYTKEHEWINVEGGLATIGITDYAQHELGDVVFVELPKPGTKIESGKSFGTVESVKAVSEIYAPVAGEVIEANGELQNTPEKSIPIRTGCGVAHQGAPDERR